MERRLLALAAAGILGAVAGAFLIAASYVALAEWLESEAIGAAIVGGVLLTAAVLSWLLSRRRPAPPAIAAADPPMSESLAAPIAIALGAIRQKPLAALAVFAAAGFAAAERPREALGIAREIARLVGGARDPDATTHHA